MAKRLILLVAVMSMFVLAGCGSSKPAPAKKLSDKPTMMYEVKAVKSSNPKYPFKIGVMTVRDKRQYSFYERDDFYREEIPQGFSKMLFSELMQSGIFSEVIYMNEVPENVITPVAMSAWAKDNGIDMVLIADLTDFMLMRQKVGVIEAGTFSITLKISAVMQLIHLETGTIVWSGNVERTNVTLAENGAPRPMDLQENTQKTLQELFADAKLLIYTNGLQVGGK